MVVLFIVLYGKHDNEYKKLYKTVNTLEKLLTDEKGGGAKGQIDYM